MHRPVGLMLRKLCGEIVCPKYHLCQFHDLQCYPCQSYCNETSNNFDANLCEQQCQGTLQDLEILKLMIICITVLMIIALVLMSITAVFMWNQKKNMWNIENNSKDSYLMKNMFSLKNNAVSMMSETMDKPLTESMMIAAPKMLRSSANKLPCEDVTLEIQENTGYDNLAMWKVSPEICSSNL
ncbi:protein grindelwald-like [Aphis craccivora]|uniref:Protein grindelwald-like n=1 Tax=Aphis craccivora TaxID=307492 RepID=A0A6G0YV19_APHCR|nr:protein grindelwald-like [Aphis craccivora]